MLYPHTSADTNRHRETQNVCCVLVFCTFLCCSVCDFFCTGHFVMVPLNLTCLHCLQHSFLEHFFNLQYGKLLYPTHNCCTPCTIVVPHAQLLYPTHNCCTPRTIVVPHAPLPHKNKTLHHLHIVYVFVETSPLCSYIYIYNAYNRLFYVIPNIYSLSA